MSRQRAPIAHAVRAVRFDWWTPSSPPRSPSSPNRSCPVRRGDAARRDGGGHLRERSAPVRPQHRAVAHPGLHRHLPVPPRARDSGDTCVEAGAGCAIAAGTRVVVDPCIPCLPRGIDPPCANCVRGWTSSCLNLDSRVLTSGRSLGYTQGLGGGWADTVLAHESMLHPLPDAIGDRGASLYEPVSIACHALMRAMPDDGDPVLVVGGRHHRPGRPRRAPRAVPALPGHRAGPAPPSGCGGDGVRGGPRRAQRSGQRPLGGTGLADRSAWWDASVTRC